MLTTPQTPTPPPPPPPLHKRGLATQDRNIVRRYFLLKQKVNMNLCFVSLFPTLSHSSSSSSSSGRLVVKVLITVLTCPSSSQVFPLRWASQSSSGIWPRLMRTKAWVCLWGWGVGGGGRRLYLCFRHIYAHKHTLAHVHIHKQITKKELLGRNTLHKPITQSFFNPSCIEYKQKPNQDASIPPYT